MTARKPRIEYYWVPGVPEWRVNWRLIGANGEIMCQSTQGFRDKTDAQRSIRQIVALFLGEPYILLSSQIRQVGPGR